MDINLTELEEQALIEEMKDEQRREYWDAVKDNNPDLEFEDF